MDSLNRLRYTVDEKKEEAAEKIDSLKDRASDKYEDLKDKAEDKLNDMRDNIDIRRGSIDEASDSVRRTSIGSMQFDDDELIF